VSKRPIILAEACVRLTLDDVIRYWQVPYYWVGCKMYDILAGKENMEKSYLMSKSRALEAFPMLKSEGLVGAIVYYDGQHNDSRMNVALAMTAVKHGATVANHTEVTALHKDADGKLCGARVRDNMTGAEWDVACKVCMSLGFARFTRVS
jgi:glycerol-3-phosphate dehydrogenase